MTHEAEEVVEEPTVCERPTKAASVEDAAAPLAPPGPPPPSPAPEPDQTLVRPLARPPGLGDVIAEKYRLVRTLGRGGMGRIFAADHLLLGTTVALKFMHPHLARDRAQVTRFSREARAAATLKSPNAARIIDVDQLPTGELYIVMEYLDGTSLETMAVDGHGLPIADAVKYVVQACDALAEAHSRSIIHRDVKPANLFLTKGKSGEPVIKVLDFGLAKSMASSDGFSAVSSPTVSGQALGTPYYMSPEQITGSTTIDGRSDIWAIGATLYELLTGQLAFAGANAPVVFDAILKGRPAPLQSVRQDVPEALVTIVDRCLNLDVAARYQTVRELAKALEASLVVVTTKIPFVAGPRTADRFLRSSAPPAPPGPASGLPGAIEPSVRGTMVSLAEAEAEAEAEVAHGPSFRQTVLAALAGPALIAIVGGVVFLVMSTSSGSLPTAVASKAVYLTAKSGDGKRSKTPPVVVVEKTDRPRK